MTCAGRLWSNAMESWTEFAQPISSRFTLLPVDRYSFTVQFVRFSPDPQARHEIASRVTSAVVNVVQRLPFAALNAIDIRNTEDEIIRVAFTHPVYDFM